MDRPRYRVEIVTTGVLCQQVVNGMSQDIVDTLT